MSISTKYVDEIKKYFKSQQEIDEFMNYCQIPLKKSIKINLNKIGVQDFKDITSERGRHLTDAGFIGDTEFNDTFYVDRDDTSIPLGRTFLHQSGFFYVQEIAASMPPKFLDIKENDLVLDISAAPGGKSVQIGDYLLKINQNKPGLVISNDVNGSRNLALAHNITRMGIYNNAITNFNGFGFGKNIGETFDSVLVDAPCSGEGTGFKSDSSLKFWKIEEIRKIAGTSFQLLVSAIKSTKPGGTIVFSTCTLNPYENEMNVQKALEFFGDSIRLEDVQIINKSSGMNYYDGQEILSQDNADKIARFWPHVQKTGGFFVCKIRKVDTLGEKFVPKDNKFYPKNPFRLDVSSSLQKKITEYLSTNYGIKLNKDSYLFVATKNQVYIASPKVLEIRDKIGLDRIGIPVFKLSERGDLYPLHNLGTILGHLATRNFIVFAEVSAQDYSSGKDIEMNKIIDGKIDEKSSYVIIKWKKYGIGVGKIIGNNIKNKYIK